MEKQQETPMIGHWVNAQEMAKIYPDTFEVDSTEDIHELLFFAVEAQLDTWVKVCNDEERFWIKVISANSKGITGTVDNDLLGEYEYAYGDKVFVPYECVYDYLIPQLNPQGS